MVRYGKSIQNEKGSVLIVGMLLMLVMAIMGIASMQSTGLQEKMAGNQGSREVAFQAAEIVLREGERDLDSLVNPDWDGTDGLYDEWDTDVTDVPIWESINWDDTDSRVFAGAVAGVAAAPRYIIERLVRDSAECTGNDSIESNPLTSKPAVYRITSRATGRTNSTVVILQTTFKDCGV